MFLLIRDKGNQRLRTGLNTSATGCTLLLIHNGNTIHHMNGIKGTDLYTRTIATARIRAGLFCSSRNYRQVIAVCNSRIAGNLLSLGARTLAMHMGNLFFLVHGYLSGTKDFCNFLRYGTSSNRTLCYGSFSQCHSLSTTVTAGESAGTTVVSRKCPANLCLCFVNLYLKFLGGHS